MQQQVTPCLLQGAVLEHQLQQWLSSATNNPELQLQLQSAMLRNNDMIEVSWYPDNAAAWSHARKTV